MPMLWCLSLLVITTGIAHLRWRSLRPSPPILVAIAGTWMTVGIASSWAQGVLPDGALSRITLARPLDDAITLILLFCAIFNAGFALVGPRRLDMTTPQVFRLSKRHAWPALALAAVCLGLRVLLGGTIDRYSVQAASQASSGYIAYFPHIAASLALVVLAGSRRESRLTKTAGFALFATAMLIFWVSGVRFIFIGYLVAFGCLFVYRRRQNFRFPVSTLAVGSMTVVVLLGLMGNLRAGPDASYLTPTQRAVVATEVLSTSAAGMRVADRTGFLHGATYLDLLTQPIPRALWPDKPQPQLRAFLSSFTDPRDGRAIGAPVEVYVNFGWLGTALAALLLGLGMGFAVRSLIVHFRNSAGAMAYALLCILLLNAFYRGYLVATVYQSVAVMLPMLLLARKRRQTPDEVIPDIPLQPTQTPTG